MTTLRLYLLAFMVALLLVPSADPLVRAQTVITAGEYVLPASPNKEDVRVIGRGKTGIAWNPTPSAIMYNPALLATPRTRVEILDIEASIPTTTLNSLDFLSKGSTITELKTGNFLKRIRRGVGVILNNASTPDQRSLAIQDINSGLQFANDFQDKVLGSPENPKLHGVTAFPSIQGQVGNFGFSLYGILRAAFQSFPTPPLVAIYQMRVPSNFETLPQDQQLAVAARLLQVIGPLVEADPNDPLNFKLNYYDAIPTTFATAYLDIVGSFGYGYTLTPDLGIGGALKVVNRRFSTKVIDPDHYDNILKEVRSDFNSSATGVTVDLGATYRIRSTGTMLGLSVQNIIPLPKVTSTAEVGVATYDEAGNPQKVFVRVPLTLETPLLANLGATQQITPNWTASLDWVDIAAQDTIDYGNYFERFHLGTEYRLEASPGGFTTAFRVGLADGRFAGGLGFDFWRIVNLDGAYAYDNLIGAYSWFAAIRFGF